MIKVLDRWLRDIVENESEENKDKKSNRVEVYNGWKGIWNRIQKWLYPSILPTHTNKKYY